MKTKSLTAMLMAMALSFNFAACSDEEDNGGGGSASGEASKRLTKIFVQCPEGDTNNETVFQYDNEGRVSQMAITYSHHNNGSTWTDVYSYSYSGKDATIVLISDGEEYETSTYTLNDKGYVASGTKTESDGDIRQYTFNYTNDYMTLAEESYHGVSEEKNQVIADGLILPHDWDAVEYTEIPNKINFFFHYSNEIDIFDTFEYMELYLANLAGKAPKYLPESVTDGEGSWYFDYELDDEGYPTSITLSDEDGTFTTIICTYEPIS